MRWTVTYVQARRLIWSQYWPKDKLELIRRRISAVLAGDSEQLTYSFSWWETPQGDCYWEYFATHPDVPLPDDAREYLLGLLYALRQFPDGIPREYYPRKRRK